jgi:hypothetical protein
MKKVFAILKGRDHDGTGWCHLNQPWCEASEQSTDSTATVDILQCLEYGAAFPRRFYNIIYKKVIKYMPCGCFQSHSKAGEILTLQICVLQGS